MTRNLYIGADLTPIFTALPQEIPLRVAEAWATVQATNFPERAQVLAHEIAAKKPDLIGLQEAALWRIQSPGDLNTPATTVAFDFVELLLDALNERGVHYERVAVTTDADVELPSATSPETYDDIRLTDQEVILARTDLNSADLKLSNVQGGNFTSKLTVLVAGQPLEVPRGWASVDVKVGEKSFRFVTTHLETFSSLVQVAQANELLAPNGPVNTDHLPVVLVGDFNSCATPPCLDQTPTYGNLIAAGLVDAWNVAGFGPGFTCCQAENLLNTNSTLNERIDFVFLRGSFTVADMEPVGSILGERRRLGLWPSDHAGLVGTLQFR